MRISPARIAAFDALLSVESGVAFSSSALSNVDPGLDSRDRGLAHNLLMSVLRHLIPLDREIDIFTKDRKLDPEVRIALRMGLAQLRYFDRVPAHSAINESVELVRRARKSSATGLVNAVLRRATKGRVEFEFADEIDRITVETSHPRWLIEKWINDRGLDEARSMAAANGRLPRVTFRLTMRPLDADENERIARYPRSKYIDGCMIAPNFSEELRELEAAGKIYFQDEASQIVAAVARSYCGERALDVCAAPGSKTGILAMDPGFLAAGDISMHRVGLLRDNLRHQGAEGVAICRFDAEMTLPFADNSFDVILADVPCSGTGTIRNNPEIRYRVTQADIVELSRKQLRIASNASKCLKPGGKLIYSTCSLEPEENEFVIAELLKTESSLRSLTPQSMDDLVTSEGFIRTWPDRDDMDGFFAAILEKQVDR